MALTPTVKALLVCCAVAIAVLVYDNIQRGREIELLKARTLSPAPTVAPVAQVKAASMADQATCAQQAALEFKREGLRERFKNGSLDDFTSHFSAATGHCYMVTTSTAAKNNIPTSSRTLLDAFQGKVYGAYFWINTEGKKFWEVEPQECKVTLPNGEDKTCKNDDQWDSLAKVYMEAP